MPNNPVDLNRLMWLGAGAGSKGIFAGMVSGFAPQAGITPDIAAAFIGFFIAQQGGARMGSFGEGMLIAAIGQLVRQPIEGIFGQIGKGGTAPTTEAAKAAATKTAASSQGSPDESEGAYLAAKYGIV
ncbi:unnamed protein product [marine sediment metagenome]|uniref:Uncharacterized protein n=1 Tax=marine sediment metagenome TaxID=412755 RepID=X1S762_9ZZZZ